jgi:hypothetical protein
MVRQCCVCKKVHRDGRWVLPRSEDLAGREITHGYCESCYQELKLALAEIASVRRRSAALPSAA